MNGYRVAIGIAQRVSSSSIVGLEKTKVATDSTSGSEDLQHGDLEMIHDKENEVSSTGNTLQADFRSEKSFPFMKLPPEIRNTIYEMALFVPDPICIYFVWPGGNWYRPPSGVHGGLRTNRHSPRETCQLLLVCKDVYFEASRLYFRNNIFYCYGVEDLCEFLTKLTIQQRRNIRSLSFHFSDGHAPAKAMRLLRGCVSLRDLTISFTRSTLHEFGLRMPESLKRLPGLGDLLKVHSIQELQIIVPLALPYSRYYSFNGEVSPESFIKDLQVLKLPRSAASLRRQDEKDFPPEKAGRTVFGKANVITRSENAMIDGNEER
ncbi:MAG: hypothetical protein Q9198_005048 [Flavoplaca austrocitrina]